MQVVILGGSGFIGQTLMQQWLLNEPTVTLFAVSRHGKPAKVLPALANSSQITWVAQDLFDYDALRAKLPEQPDRLVNLVGAIKGNALVMAKMNVAPISIVLRLIEDLKIAKSCYVSADIGPKAYVASKKKAVVLLKESGLPVVIITPSLVYGAGRCSVYAPAAALWLASWLPGLSHIRPWPVAKVAQEILAKIK